MMVALACVAFIMMCSLALFALKSWWDVRDRVITRLTPDREKKVQSVVVVAPLENELSEKIVAGLRSHFMTSTQTLYTVSLVTGDNNRVALYEHAHHALKTCDILVAVGATCTNIAFEAVDAHKSEALVISAGLRDHHLPLVRKKNPRKVLCGVVAVKNYLNQIKQLYTINPAMKRVLVIHRPLEGSYNEDLLDIQRAFDAHQIECHVHAITHEGRLDTQISALKFMPDTIFLLPNTLSAYGQQSLISFCKTSKITLCANELDTVLMGAHIGFGGSGFGLGVRAGQVIRKIVSAKKIPHQEVMEDAMEEYRIAVNQTWLQSQPKPLYDDITFLLGQSDADTTLLQERENTGDVI